MGTVYLVGAGPGDYRLMTLRGKALLEQADVIVYDYLADDRLLRFARPDAELIYVGKRAGCHTLPQGEINSLLIEKARSNDRIVRLKGGDPFVFGRGGEEAAALAGAGISWEVVPGVTSAIAAPAYAGIPVTDRSCASSFAVITGHEDPAKENSSIDWDHLATAVDTLVFLMGIHHLSHIADRLMACGRPADTPAALVRWGTRTEQQTVVTTLADVAETAARQGIRPPAVFVVGSVVNLRQQLQWFEQKPLTGLSILVTRTRSQASALTDQLEDDGARCIEIPTIHIKEPADDYAGLDQAISRIGHYEWIVFTSANGVEAFFSRWHQAHHDIRELQGIRIACIGPATAAALDVRGILADIVPEENCSEGLVAQLAPKVTVGTTVLLARAEDHRPVLEEGLKQRGAVVHSVDAYETVMARENKERLCQALSGQGLQVITFTSSSTVHNLVALLDGRTDLLQHTAIACIGPVTAGTCRSYGLSVAIMPDQFTIPALVEAIRKWRRQEK